MAAELETTAATGSWRRRWAASARRAALLSLLFAAIVGCMFFVLGTKDGHPTPGELDEVSLVGRPDAFLVVWILSWSSHALVEQPFELFDANAFHPSEDSLAYTESLLLVAPPYTLLHAATGNPFLALNLLLLLLTFLNLWGGYLLGEWLTGRVDAGILAAVLFAFNGYAGAQRAHVQLQVMFLIPVALLLLFRWLEERRFRYALLFVLAAVAQSVTAAYYGVLLLVVAAVVLAGYLAVRRFRPGRGFWPGLLAAGALALLLVAPFVSVYLRLDDQRIYDNPKAALNASDLLTPAFGSLLYRGMEQTSPAPLRRTSEHRFFPGFLACGLAAVGLVMAVGCGGRRTYAALLAVAAAACLVLALGAEAQGVRLPYAWLREHVPGVNGVRVPARLALAAVFAVGQLAAVGYAGLTERWWRRGRGRLVAAVATALVAVALLENASRTVHQRFDVLAEAEVNRALAAAPDGAVVELPIALGVGPVAAHMEGARLMLSIYDWKPRVNGYSGGYPEGYFRRAQRIDRFPEPDALALLCELDVRYVVLRVDGSESSRPFGEQDAARVLAALPPGASHSEHGGDHLVDLQGWRDAGGCAAAAGGV